MGKNKRISLDEMDRKVPFTVPENYFEQFAVNIEAQIAKATVVRHKLLKPWMYFAAIFVGIVMLGNVGYFVHQHNKSVEAENYEVYISSQLDEASVMDYYITETSLSKK